MSHYTTQDEEHSRCGSTINQRVPNPAETTLDWWYVPPAPPAVQRHWPALRRESPVDVACPQCVERLPEQHARANKPSDGYKSDVDYVSYHLAYRMPWGSACLQRPSSVGIELASSSNTFRPSIGRPNALAFTRGRSPTQCDGRRVQRHVMPPTERRSRKRLLGQIIDQPTRWDPRS